MQANPDQSRSSTRTCPPFTSLSFQLNYIPRRPPVIYIHNAKHRFKTVAKSNQAEVKTEGNIHQSSPAGRKFPWQSGLARGRARVCRLLLDYREVQTHGCNERLLS